MSSEQHFTEVLIDIKQHITEAVVGPFPLLLAISSFGEALHKKASSPKFNSCYIFSK